MTIDEKISTEKVRHQRVIKELRELLAVYQNDNDNYRVDRNINQAVSSGFNADNIAAYEDSRKNINPYAEQVKDLQGKLNAEIELHAKNMQALEDEKKLAEENEKKRKENLQKELDQSIMNLSRQILINDAKQYMPENVSAIRKDSEFSYDDKFFYCAYDTNGNTIASQIPKEFYDSLKTYFEKYPGDLEIRPTKEKVDIESVINQIKETHHGIKSIKPNIFESDNKFYVYVEKDLTITPIEISKEIYDSLKEYFEHNKNEIDAHKTSKPKDQTEQIDQEELTPEKKEIIKKIIHEMLIAGEFPNPENNVSKKFADIDDVEKQLSKKTQKELEDALYIWINNINYDKHQPVEGKPKTL